MEGGACKSSVLRCFLRRVLRLQQPTEPPNLSRMTEDIDFEKARRLLAVKRAEMASLSELSEEARKPPELDQQSVGRLSRIDAMQQQAMALANERARKRELMRIEMAERRLAAGDYGYCVDCGEPVAARRLEIDPMAERCIHCVGRR